MELYPRCGALTTVYIHHGRHGGTCVSIRDAGRDARIDNLHELVVHRSSEYLDAQPVFALFPDLEEYKSRDLFSPHPNLSDLWMHRGRRDDLVVLLNGEKTNPISFQAEVTAHPDVCDALVAPNQRVEACLIVEPTPEELQQMTEDNAAKEDFIEKIWPAIEEANGTVQGMLRSPVRRSLYSIQTCPCYERPRTLYNAQQLCSYMLSTSKHSIQSDMTPPSATSLDREYATTHCTPC